MKKEFVPYEESVELKGLGFEEPCFGFWDGYNGQSHLFFKPRKEYHWFIRLFKTVPDITTYNQDLLEYEEGDNAVLAPLFQQAFKWFRKKYPTIDFGIGKIHDGSDNYHFHINLVWEFFVGTYREAELACLRKLIDMAKNKYNISMKIDDIIKEVNSPEYKEKQIKKNKDYLQKISMDRQLGYYIGEKIVSDYLPTLSTDMIKSRKAIEVTPEDTLENKKLYEEWFMTTRYMKNWDGQNENGDKEKWEKYYHHNKMLEKKYLPPKLECFFGLIKVNDMDQFKEGLRSSLWDCDMCSYNIEKENIEIEYDMEYGFTNIKLKLID